MAVPELVPKLAASLPWLFLVSVGGCLGETSRVYGQDLDPAAWGEDHVGRAFPQYLTSDECLFCHRDDIGVSWQANPHNRSLRVAQEMSPAIAALARKPGLAPVAQEVTFLLGGNHRTRYLKPNGRYGQLSLLNLQWRPPRDGQAGHLVEVEEARWDSELFADSCAGCHTTAVDARLRAYSSPSLQCFTCHGDVPAAHEDEPGRVYFSGQRAVEPRLEVSICGQCHLRGGASRSTGRPYPNTYVAGDNLLRDYAVDWSQEHLDGLNPADGHIYRTVRDVVLRGRETLTCLTCHDVHGASSAKHRSLRATGPVDCSGCHPDLDDFTAVVSYSSSSPVCQWEE